MVAVTLSSCTNARAVLMVNLIMLQDSMKFESIDNRDRSSTFTIYDGFVFAPLLSQTAQRTLAE
jgi:hypothetical protein